MLIYIQSLFFKDNKQVVKWNIFTTKKFVKDDYCLSCKNFSFYPFTHKFSLVPTLVLKSKYAVSKKFDLQVSTLWKQVPVNLNALIRLRHRSALEFQHFLPRQIQCRGNYMKIHFASALFLPRLVGFYIKSLGIYLGILGKNIDET